LQRLLLLLGLGLGLCACGSDTASTDHSGANDDDSAGGDANDDDAAVASDDAGVSDDDSSAAAPDLDDDDGASDDDAAEPFSDAGIERDAGSTASDDTASEAGYVDAGATASSDGGFVATDAGPSGSVPPEAGEPLTTPDLPACDCSACSEEAVEVTSAQHVDGPVDYGPGAPAGGDHNACWATWGIHDEPVAPENFVHNLEHGGVALLYDCPDGCDAEVTALQQFVLGHELTVLTPLAGMRTRFAVTSWGYRLETDCLDMALVASFYDDHADHGPEQFSRPPPDPPASCE
jgi:hypothetical protein